MQSDSRGKFGGASVTAREREAGTGLAEAEVTSLPTLPRSVHATDRHADISMYFGFTPIKTPEVTKDDQARARVVVAKHSAAVRDAASKNAVENHEPAWHLEERITLLRTFAERALEAMPQPIMIYHRRPWSKEKRPPREVHCGLDILGTTKPAAEALAIATACAMLRDDGYESLIIDINSVGDRDGMARHERELGLFTRKHLHSFPVKWRNCFKANPLLILDCDDEECAVLRESAPKSVSFLGEAGRRHFMEVLEHLESLELPYRINHGLLGDRIFSSHVLFKIKAIAGEEEVTVAVGSRYTILSKKIGLKKEIPAIGTTIQYRKPGADAPWKPIVNPKFYFVQFGDEARIRSLRLIEALRREHIAVHHSITKDKLINQITAAESLRVPYLLIMGQKEAIDGTIVVRDMNTRAQETVGVSELVHYLKKLR